MSTLTTYRLRAAIRVNRPDVAETVTIECYLVTEVAVAEHTDEPMLKVVVFGNGARTVIGDFSVPLTKLVSAAALQPVVRQ